MKQREIMELLENCPDIAHAVISDMLEKLGGSFVWREEDANRMERSGTTVMMIMDDDEQTVTFTIEQDDQSDNDREAQCDHDWVVDGHYAYCAREGCDYVRKPQGDEREAE